MSALLAVLLACAGEEAEPPTFARVQGEILTPSCAFSSCHAGAGGSAGLDLTEGAAWAAIVDVPARDVADEVLVVPGDPLASYLWKKCAAEPGITGDPMPVGAAGGLDSARLALLTDWIEAGAAP